MLPRYKKILSKQEKKDLDTNMSLYKIVQVNLKLHKLINDDFNKYHHFKLKAVKPS